MERVLGIGGFFFRADNPADLLNWYANNLGIDLPPPDYNTPPWQQQAGYTVVAPFPRDTDYFGSSENKWMLNFRVSSLDRMVAQLRSSGVEVTVDPESYPNGRFARLADPEGNPIQLWEPAAPDTE